MEDKILIVDDEVAARELAGHCLRQAGYETLEASSGRQALVIARAETPSLVLLDLMLPGRDGWEVCRELRASGSVPIIMFLEQDAETERLLGFALGADDYVTKPLRAEELLVKVRAVLQSARRPAAHQRQAGHEGVEADSRDDSRALGPAGHERIPPILDHRHFRLNRLSRELEVRGRVVKCSSREFDLLWLLVGHPDRVFSREELLQRVWGPDYGGEPHVVDAHVGRLRRKIEVVPERPRYLQTVWGTGYRFGTEPERS